MDVYFVRHAESQKSREDRHGGNGMPLTAQGRADIKDLVRFLEHHERLLLPEIRVVCTPRVQVEETCSLMAASSSMTFMARHELQSIHLGVLDGLSKAEAAARFPETAAQLESWRQGDKSIDSFEIPGAENMATFYTRVSEFVKQLVAAHKTAIVVGTRSVGVAVANAALSNFGPFQRHSYKRYSFDPCSVSKFGITAGGVGEHYINRTDFLSSAPRHRDD